MKTKTLSCIWVISRGKCSRHTFSQISKSPQTKHSASQIKAQSHHRRIHENKYCQRYVWTCCNIVSIVSFWNCSSQSQTRNYQTATKERWETEHVKKNMQMLKTEIVYLDDCMILLNYASLHPAADFSFELSDTQQPGDIQPPSLHPFFSAFLLNMHLLLLKRLKDFFFSSRNWVGCQIPNISRQISPCALVLLSLQSIIVSVWLGWIYL